MTDGSFDKLEAVLSAKSGAVLKNLLIMDVFISSTTF